MITPPSAENKPQDQSAVALEPGFEVAMQAFWEKNRTAVLAVCMVALLGILGREGWRYYTIQQEIGVRQEYARIADRPDQLATFAAANSGHVLSGVAYLRLADSKYAAGDFRAAAENYSKAAAGLKNAATLGRARLGAAMSQLNSGDKAAGEAALKTIQADVTLAKGPRIEAAYHLATLAHDAGNAAEVTRLAAEANKLDATSYWAQRAASLAR